MPTDINTISAWAFLISTLVSALTGFFIVQTFLLQAKVAQEQSKITTLEIERSIMEKRPVFFAKRHKFPEEELETEDYRRFKVELTLLRNDIYDYKLDLILDENSRRYYEFRTFSNGSDGLIEGSVVTIAYTISKNMKFLYYSENQTSFAFRLEITYKDSLDNQYIQNLMIYNDNEPLSYPPESKSLKENFKKLRF